MSLKVIFAFMFLTISTCWNPWLIPDSGWKWWIAYRSKFSKTSPAISELALQGCDELQGFALFCQLHVRGVPHCCRVRLHGCWLSGHFKINFVAVKSSTFFPHQVLWHHTVTQPHNIEVPRSLVEVVVSWNLPMHRWLKQYVFKQVGTFDCLIFKPPSRRGGGWVLVALFWPPIWPPHYFTAFQVDFIFSKHSFTILKSQVNWQQFCSHWVCTLGWSIV